MDSSASSLLTHLECPECHTIFVADRIQTFCQDCRSPLLARYDIDAIRSTLTVQNVAARKRGIWRWAELLPVRRPENRITLGEGDTPLINLPRISRELGCSNIFLKDESVLPTGSFKARGLLMAVARARELGIEKFVIPTAGNAGSALATYCARARLEAHIYMPADTPRAIQQEMRAAGADVTLVNGLINDAARLAAEQAKINNWFDVSTFKEPYRVEGKKTMGLELAQAFDWRLPDVIIYPTGGGTGLVGMWKAFEELESLGWIDGKRPRMVSVQPSGCAPVVKAFHEQKDRTEVWQGAHTIAPGLRVPAVFADRLILRTLRESHGTAVSVSDDEIMIAQEKLARSEGIFAAPEGAAPLAALERLVQQQWIEPQETVVLFNTGHGLKNI